MQALSAADAALQPLIVASAWQEFVEPFDALTVKLDSVHPRERQTKAFSEALVTSSRALRAHLDANRTPDPETAASLRTEAHRLLRVASDYTQELKSMMSSAPATASPCRGHAPLMRRPRPRGRRNVRRRATVRARGPDDPHLEPDHVGAA